MARNKVVYFDETLMDITDTTATPFDMVSGKSFYGADGVKVDGLIAACDSAVIDSSRVYCSGSVKLQSKSATPTKSEQTILPDSDYNGLSSVIVSPIPNEYIIPSGTKTITKNGTTDVSQYKSVTVNVEGASEPVLQSKTITPDKSSHVVTADSDYDALYQVTVEAIPDNYIDTSDADAVADDITAGKTAYVNGVKITGTKVVEVIPEPIYSLGETEFDGATYIDTGIQLENEDINHTIVLDAITSYEDAQTCILHCMHEAAPWNGMTIDLKKNEMRCIWKSSSNSKELAAIGLNSGTRDFKLIITHVKGSGKYKFGALNCATGRIIFSYVSQAFSRATENLLIGAIQDTNGVKSRYFIGTIREVRIYDVAVSDDYCYRYLRNEL